MNSLPDEIIREIAAHFVIADDYRALGLTCRRHYYLLRGRAKRAQFWANFIRAKDIYICNITCKNYRYIIHFDYYEPQDGIVGLREITKQYFTHFFEKPPIFNDKARELTINVLNFNARLTFNYINGKMSVIFKSDLEMVGGWHHIVKFDRSTIYYKLSKQSVLPCIEDHKYEIDGLVALYNLLKESSADAPFIIIFGRILMSMTWPKIKLRL